MSKQLSVAMVGVMLSLGVFSAEAWQIQNTDTVINTSIIMTITTINVSTSINTDIMM
ncbi:hypothetical protein AJ90_05450 [Vibrio parahaemolyticus M0605]|nr:hypothetical protein AJ90_05450 [Vibrio parahaemolyticus M0605]